MINIIGAGISGLNSALNLIDKHDVTIYEKSDYVGGRVYTVPDYKYEAGAARFNKNHKNLIKLITKYKLKSKIIQIPSSWESVYSKKVSSKYFDNVFDLIDDTIKKSKKIGKKKLQSITFHELVKELYDTKTGTFLKQSYPYYSELCVLNAYDSIRTLTRDLSEKDTFYVLDGGLSQLINRMKDDFIKKGGKLKLNSELTNIEIVENNSILCSFITGEKTICESLILACDGKNLQNMAFLNKFKIHDLLNSVKCEPLLRTYAIYNNKWFNDLPKIVTNEYIKYIIPIDYDSGLVMISYTDGFYAKYWKKIIDSKDGIKKQKKIILEQLKLLFPNKHIGNPNKLFNNYWDRGACYWKTNTNSDKLIPIIAKPTKYNIYICGDSYSGRQAWMEGALESSNFLKKVLTKNV